MSEADEARRSSPRAPRSLGLVRRAGWLALVLALVLAPIVARVWIDGRAELAAADAAATAGDVDAELRHLGRAARLRMPLASFDERARGRLRERAEAASEAERTSEALAAWRELRRALLATRVVGVVDRDQLDAANAAIVELMLIEARAAGYDEAGQRRRWTAQLDEDQPSRGRSLFAAACFVGWLVASVSFFLVGVDGTGRLLPRAALRSGGVALVLLVAWILSM